MGAQLSQALTMNAMHFNKSTSEAQVIVHTFLQVQFKEKNQKDVKVKMGYNASKLSLLIMVALESVHANFLLTQPYVQPREKRYIHLSLYDMKLGYFEPT